MARELAPAGLRSGPKITVLIQDFASAAHSSGSKLPATVITPSVTSLKKSLPAPSRFGYHFVHD
ncbi:MAG: hypothetical protein C0411_13775 [Pseudomonas sp.]|nr:hypothetical protein [Pseudomonas sp.]